MKRVKFQLLLDIELTMSKSNVMAYFYIFITIYVFVLRSHLSVTYIFCYIVYAKYLSFIKIGDLKLSRNVTLFI